MPISGDLKPGGNYQLEGNAGGRILECEAPRRLGITWEYGGDLSWVTVRLDAESEESTRLQLEHVAQVPPEFWDQYGPGAVGVGWEQGLLGLANHLQGGGRAYDRVLHGRTAALAAAPAMHAFDVLGSPVRRRILELLATGELSSGEVSAIAEEEFGISQPAVSQHLKVLRDSGFARVRREGARRIYLLNAPPIEEMEEWLDVLRAAWDRRLDALETEIARGKRRGN